MTKFLPSRVARSVARVALLASAAAWAGLAQAEPGTQPARHWLWLAADAGAVESGYRADPFLGGGRGTDLRFQDEAGHPKRPVATRFGAGLALGASWLLEVEGSSWSSAGTYTPASAVQLAETSFEAARPLSTHVQVRQFEVLGGYRWLQQPDAEWGLLFGGGGLVFDGQYDGRSAGAAASRTKSERVTRLQLGLYGRRGFGTWGEAAVRLLAGTDTTVQLGWRWPLASGVRLEAAYRWSRVSLDPVPLEFMSARAGTTALNITRAGPSLALRADF